MKGKLWFIGMLLGWLPLISSAQSHQVPSATPSTSRLQMQSQPDTLYFSLPQFAGTMGAANAFLAYTNVVLVGDAYMAGLQPDSIAIALLTGTENLVEMVQQSLQQLRSSATVSAQSRLVIGEMELIFDGVREMIRELKRFIDQGEVDRKQFERYETARAATWKRLSRFLGLQQ